LVRKRETIFTKIWIASGKISTGESGSGNAAAVKGEIQRKYISKKTKVDPKTAASENRICLTQKNVSYNDLISQRLSDKKIKVIKMQKNLPRSE